jgi:hypothetical protein
LGTRSTKDTKTTKKATTTFFQKRQKAVALGLGSIWTWTVICADTKLIPTWRIGSRDAGVAYEVMQDVASRLRHRVQLTTDGHKPYLETVEAAFGADIDYAMLQKIYGADPAQRRATARRVSRLPMSMRRFTRLTNAFSKKVENHAAAIALYFMYYNFGRVHQTLRVTPAMEAGAADHVWSIEEIVALID